MLTILQNVYQQIRQHGEQTYPNESCGVLLGSLSSSSRTVAQAIPTPNAETRSPQNRFQIDSLQLVRIHRQARLANLEIIGFYHSHPDHPAQCSPTDLAEAHWLGCSSVITTIANGIATHTNSFLLVGSSEEDKCFLHEQISLIP